MVYSVFVEKKPQFSIESAALLSEINNLLGIKSVKKVRLINRYDCEGMSLELFKEAVYKVFSEPQLDDVSYSTQEGCEIIPAPSDNGVVFAVEYLPGQFDQRADSAAQCIQIMSCGERPKIRTAKIYVIEGAVSKSKLDTIKKYVINPVEAREASVIPPITLDSAFIKPESVEILDGFINLDEAELDGFIKKYGLAMDRDDLRFCRDYFRKEGRNPTISEVKIIDTYWSDHCRHTTFLTTIDSINIEDETVKKAYNRYIDVRKELGRTKPINLMDMGTLAAKYLKSIGKLNNLDESEEINACTVKVNVDVDGIEEPWLLLFKNETHNHPTEIEPFGGAATCIGGAIRDPLSGRSYVYAAMRVTGAADPTLPLSETIPGKLPQRKIVQTAAAGYSSYGNQIGLATGIVDELYHSGYAAKRMEIGAVIAATPEKNVRRECPCPGDRVILLGGRTGRDGIGGATGSSKAHDSHSVETCSAEVQKGNAPEERKLQRLFRNGDACRMIKRCNDFGAGGVSVAIGELADGLDINLDAVPKKYEGLDGTELAISESQERMAVVVAEEDVEKFMSAAGAENLEATVVATVTESPRMVMHWNGQTVCDISRDFLNSNGAEKHIDVCIPKLRSEEKVCKDSFSDNYRKLVSNLNVCSKRGLGERFDSTIGAGTVLMPFGGKYQKTPIQAMVHRLPVEKGHTETCSFMSWGYNPVISENNPYRGAYLAVVESVSKLVAAGADINNTYLTFQEYFEKPLKDRLRWGKPASALLGAFSAQLDLGIGAIGGKDSMSGSFEKLDVPPTLVSFAVTTGKVGDVISGEFKSAGHRVIVIRPEYDENGIPLPESLKACYARVISLIRNGKIHSAYTPTFGGIAEAVYKMCIGNRIGFNYSDVSADEIFRTSYGSFILEADSDTDGITVGFTSEKPEIVFKNETVSLDELDNLYEGKLEKVYPTLESKKAETYNLIDFRTEKRVTPAVKCAKPKLIIPVFPGTNCEYDTAKAASDAGAEPEIFVINNLSADGIARSAEQFALKLSESQILFVPGGFSGGDEPDGSGKFITAFLRNAYVKEQVHSLLDRRDGLVGGICNGFQALIKVGLVPYGKIIDTDENTPTLTFNNISRHQSKLVRIRVCSNKSPWLAGAEVGQVYTVPISHGEGKFVCSEQLMKDLIANGQISTCYVDFDGNPTDDIRFNPNGSFYAVEGISSLDGRVFGKMGHTERCVSGLYKNVGGNYDMKLFGSAVRYFK